VSLAGALPRLLSSLVGPSAIFRRIWHIPPFALILIIRCIADLTEVIRSCPAELIVTAGRAPPTNVVEGTSGRTIRITFVTLRYSSFIEQIPCGTDVHRLLVFMVTTRAGPLERIVINFLLVLGLHSILSPNAGINYLFSRAQDTGN
jgi:hypothetical protein